MQTCLTTEQNSIALCINKDVIVGNHITIWLRINVIVDMVIKTIDKEIKMTHFII